MFAICVQVGRSDAQWLEKLLNNKSTVTSSILTTVKQTSHPSEAGKLLQDLFAKIQSFYQKSQRLLVVKAANIGHSLANPRMGHKCDGWDQHLIQFIKKNQILQQLQNRNAYPAGWMIPTWILGLPWLSSCAGHSIISIFRSFTSLAIVLP